MAVEVSLADKDEMERKVYLLPTELVARIKSYQTGQGIASEVEAARRLLDSALQMRDTVSMILDKLRARFVEEKDLRVLARDVLVGHSQVTKIAIEDDFITFDLKSGSAGSMNRAGETFIGETGIDRMQRYPEKGHRSLGTMPDSGLPWESQAAAAKSDDDDIPF